MRSIRLQTRLRETINSSGRLPMLISMFTQMRFLNGLQYMVDDAEHVDGGK